MKQVYLLIERIRTEMNAKLIIHSSLVFIDVDEKKELQRRGCCHGM
jgi:hypothetical protein